MEQEIKTKQKRRIVLLIMSISALIITVVGATYAYFTAELTGNETSETISVKAGRLTINYNNGKNINISNTLPQDEALDTKVFTVVGNNNTNTTMPYFIELHVTENGFSEDAIQYTMTSGNISGNGTEAPSIATKTGVPTGTGVYSLGEAEFVMGEGQTHSYTISLYFPNDADKNQNVDQGKTIKAYIAISGEALLKGELLADTIKTANPLKTGADFNIAADATNTATQSGLFSAPDDYGTSYYYRGVVNNNNVIFGGYQWKIIRTDGRGNIKLIYNGTEAQFNTAGSVNTTGANTQLPNTAFNTTANNNKYVGYIVDGGPSTIKTVVDTFYAGLSLDAKAKIVDSIYCNDQSGTPDAYGSTLRLTANPPLPSFICPESAGKLMLPVGLITADEVAYAGGKYATSNSAYYLYNASNYWTMSPYRFDGDFVNGWSVRFGGNVSNSDVYSDYGARPIITLSSEIRVTGTGSSTDPYKIV